MVTLNWPINSKGDHLTIFNWINWVPYFIFNSAVKPSIFAYVFHCVETVGGGGEKRVNLESGFH